MALSEFVSASFGYDPEEGSIATKSRTEFQWGGTIFALLLLILNRTARQSSSLQTTLLVFYLLTSLPNALFNIVRGPFGSWLSFVAVAANLIVPESFPVARFILFVIVPDSVANGLRDTSAGCIVCLLIALLLALIKLRISDEFKCNCHTFCYFLCIAFLLFFAVTLWK